MYFCAKIGLLPQCVGCVQGWSQLRFTIRIPCPNPDTQWIYYFLQPEELSVKTEGDVLVILAKHETQTETGGSFVSKQFEQRFSLPSGVKPESIISALGRDGTLKVTAPRTSSQQANLSFKKTRGSLEEEVPNRAETTQNPANQGLSIFFQFLSFFISISSIFWICPFSSIFQSCPFLSASSSCSRFYIFVFSSCCCCFTI